MKSLRLLQVSLVLGMLLACNYAAAQSFTGSISGTITDASGAVVPGVHIIVTQLETNRQARVVSAGNGVYLATALPVGDYRVEAAAQGFKLAVRTGIILELNQAAHIDIALGFDSETPWTTSLDGITPLNLLRNPYPSGISPSLGSTRGLLSAVGQGFRAKEYSTPSSWTQQWNVTIQRTLPGSLFFEIGAIGTRGRGMPFTYYPNELDPKYQSLGAKLNELVPNPFYGIVTDGIFASKTVSRGQLLRPFPQFTDLTDAQNIGSDTWYNALQTTVKKRLGHGLQFETSYVWSKSIDRGEGSPQNHYRMDFEKSISTRDTPHRWVASYLYELPFGKGRFFLRSLPRAVESLVGGWQFNGITTLQSGAGLSITASNTAGTFGQTEFANNNGKSGALSGRAQDRLNRWFDTSVFSQPDPFTYGNLAPRLSDIRSHYTNNFDLSLFKEFHPVGEWLKLQFRAEALNAFNRVQFAAPNTSVTSSSFGRVTAQANTPRQVQFGLKLLW